MINKWGSINLSTLIIFFDFNADNFCKARAYVTLFRMDATDHPRSANISAISVKAR